jgi:hypothetical protein
MMKTVAPFGIVTGCCPGDKFMVQATLASVRHFSPQTPICLVADGGVEVGDLQRAYDLEVLRTEDLADTEMRKVCYGSQHAKLAALWAGPFERFVWMDSDAIMWGDFSAQVREDLDFQIFWSEVSVEADAQEVPPWLPHFYFDLDKLRQCDAGFEWRGLAYSSTGAFACRRNCISFEEWERVAQWNQRFKEPVFKFGEQGQLVYMVHSAAQRGALRVEWTDLQYVTRHVGCEEIERDIADAGWHFPKNIRRPRVAHFCGQKPFILNRRAYSRPFTTGRLEHYRRTKGEIGTWWSVWKEELAVMAKKIRSRIGRIWGHAQ